MHHSQHITYSTIQIHPTMPIRLDNNGKRKALICEELKPETRYEEHIRIEEEKEFKKQRKNKRAINKMKKQGKLRSISGFLVVKDEEDDDYIKSKKDKFVKNRSIRGSTIRSRKALSKPRATKKPPPKPREEPTESDTSEEESDDDVMDEDKYKEMVAFLQKSDEMLHRFQAETGMYFSNSDDSDEDLYMEDITKFKSESSPQKPESSHHRLLDEDSEEEEDEDDILSFRPFKKANNKPIKRKVERKHRKKKVRKQP